MKKLFASDFDGTVSRGGISDVDRDAIAAWRADGNLFCVVTGRSVHGSIGIFDQADIDFILAANGATLITPDGAVEVFGRYDARTVRTLWEMSIELGSGGYGPQSENESIWISTDDDSREEKIAEYLSRNATVCHSNMVFDSIELAQKAACAIGDRCGDAVTPLCNGRSVDIPPIGIDKAWGVRRAAERYGIADSALYSAGNEMNDYSMVAAFCGYAMQGSPAALCEAARGGIVDDVAAALRSAARGE